MKEKTDSRPTSTARKHIEGVISGKVKPLPVEPTRTDAFEPAPQTDVFEPAICAYCFYYESLDLNIGDCHRNPGQARTAPQNWCGEFKEAQNGRT